MPATPLMDEALKDWRDSMEQEVDQELTETKVKPEKDNVEEIKPIEQPEYTELEQKALDMGWRPKEEWKGDESEWTNAKDYVKFGEVMQANRNLHSKIDHMQNKFDERLKNLQTFHEQNLKAQVDKLKAERDHAASEADMETYQRANEQIDKLLEAEPNKPQIKDPTAVVNNIISHPTTQDFIKKNPWIEGNSAKAVYGQKVFSDWLQQNIDNPDAHLEDGLRQISESVSREFPKTNPNRDNVQTMAERKGGPKKAATQIGLTMDELNAEELRIWQTMGSTWKNQEAFLQTVIDSRKENE